MALEIERRFLIKNDNWKEFINKKIYIEQGYLSKSIDGMIINPICPMSLASRPIVIPNTSTVIIKPVKKSKGEIKLWTDGSKCMTIKENYYCEIKKGKSPCKIIKFKKSTSYYNTLIKKLDWKGDLSPKNFKN